MKAADAVRLAGAAAALGGALRLAAAFIPAAPGNLEIELLYFIIDVALLFGLVGLYAADCERLGWLGLAGFVTAATGLASIVGPDADIGGINIYAIASAVIGIGLAIMSVAMLLYGRLPRWIPTLWIASLLAGIAASVLPDKAQLAFLIAGVFFALGFLGAGVVLFSRPSAWGAES